MTTYIYTLSDPRTNAVRYVGRTIAPEQRFYAHKMSYDGTPKANWILELKNEGVLPDMVIIDSADDKMDAQEKEQYWINCCRADGCNLLNQTSAFMSNFMFHIPLPLFGKLRSLCNAHRMEMNELVCHLIDNAELPAKEQSA